MIAALTFAFTLAACSGGGTGAIPTTAVPATKAVSSSSNTNGATVSDYSNTITYNSSTIDSCATNHPTLYGTWTVSYSEHIVRNQNGTHIVLKQTQSFVSSSPPGYTIATDLHINQNAQTFDMNGSQMTDTEHQSATFTQPDGTTYSVTVLEHMTFNANGQLTSETLDIDNANCPGA